MASASEKEVAERKTREVGNLAKLISEYNVIGVAGLYKVRAVQLQELRKKFKSDIHLRVAKNVLMKRALHGCKEKRPDVEKLSEHLGGSSVLLFSNMNPFRLSLSLEKSKIRATARAGDVAPDDIIVHAGNTGLPPGPAISELHEVGIRTRIEAGSVWIVRDTVVAKKGQTISPRLASVLSKLGVKPLEIGLSMVAAYDGRSILTGDQLRLDLNLTKRQLEEAHGCAFNLAVNAAYPVPETVTTILQGAYSETRSLAINAAYMAPEVAPEILKKAYSQMLCLATKLAQINRIAAPIGHKHKSREPPKEKVEKEEAKKKDQEPKGIGRSE